MKTHADSGRTDMTGKYAKKHRKNTFTFVTNETSGKDVYACKVAVGNNWEARTGIEHVSLERIKSVL